MSTGRYHAFRFLRRSEWPLLVSFCLAIPFLTWSLRTASSTPSELEAMELLSVEETHPETKRIQHNPTRNIQRVQCKELINRSYPKGDNVTSNREKMNLRLTEDGPSFWISLHAKEKDKIRWSIMERGRYYEQIEVSKSTTVIWATQVFVKL